MPVKALSHSQRVRPHEARPNAANRGYDRDWQKLRAWKLSENPECEIPGCEHPATVVDHKKPLSQCGARLDPDNLRSLCRRHHDMISDNLRKTGHNEMPAGSRSE